jgi:hypothetical protein
VQKHKLSTIMTYKVLQSSFLSHAIGHTDFVSFSVGELGATLMHRESDQIDQACRCEQARKSPRGCPGQSASF